MRLTVNYSLTLRFCSKAIGFLASVAGRPYMVENIPTTAAVMIAAVAHPR